MGEHPVETSLIIGSALPLFVPSLVSGPVLWMFGWVFELVRFLLLLCPFLSSILFLIVWLINSAIGSAAAAIQASAGNVAAGGA
jgi:hypothetical protein